MNIYVLFVYSVYILFFLLGGYIVYINYTRNPAPYRGVAYLVIFVGLLSAVFVYKGVRIVHETLTMYEAINQVQDEIDKTVKKLGKQVQTEFQLSMNEKYILWKKGTLSELYTFKTADVLRATGHPYDVVSFQVQPRPVVAELSARSISIKPAPFVTPDELLQYIGTLVEYFVLDHVNIKYDEKAHSYRAAFSVTQWEWGRATAVSNPYVYLYLLNNGEKELLTKGYFLDLYPMLDRSKAYFIQRVTDIQGGEK